MFTNVTFPRLLIGHGGGGKWRELVGGVRGSDDRWIGGPLDLMRAGYVVCGTPIAHRPSEANLVIWVEM